MRFDVPAWLNTYNHPLSTLMLSEHRPTGFEFFVGGCKTLYLWRVYAYISCILHSEVYKVYVYNIITHVCRVCVYVHVHCALCSRRVVFFVSLLASFIPHLDGGGAGSRIMLNIHNLHTRRVHTTHITFYYRKLLIVLNFSSIYNIIYL